MKKIVIFLVFTTILLSGCKSKDKEISEVEEPQEVQHVQDYQEPVDPVTFVDDYAEEIKPQIEEADPVVKEDVSEYTFTNRKNIKYHCFINNDSYSLKTTRTEKGSIEGPYSYDIDFDIYKRVKKVIEELTSYDDRLLDKVCESLGVEDVDKDEWLGYMCYSMSRGQEKNEGSTYYDNGYETLEELEQVIEEYEKTISGYAEPDDDYDYEMEEKLKQMKEDNEEDTEEINNEITIEKISTSDPDIHAFYVNNTIDDTHHVSDGLITPEALRLFLKNHGILDKAPITITDTNNYYLYVYGYNDVKLKDISKAIAAGMIGVMGEVEYKHDKSEKYKEIYVIIPVDKTVFFSNTAITASPM